MPLDVSRRLIETETHVKTLIKDWLAEYYPGTWSYAPVQNGLGIHGVHDRIACVPIKVTPEMVGGRVGIFVSIEAKKPGRRGEARRGLSAHQLHAMQNINDAAGVSLCVDGEEDLRLFDHRIWELRNGSR